MFYKFLSFSSFREYLDCSESTARKTCGVETGLFTRGYLDKMSTSLIKTYCEGFINKGLCSEFSSASSWKISSVFISVILVNSFFNLR